MSGYFWSDSAYVYSTSSVNCQTFAKHWTTVNKIESLKICLYIKFNQNPLSNFIDDTGGRTDMFQSPSLPSFYAHKTNGILPLTTIAAEPSNNLFSSQWQLSKTTGTLGSILYIYIYIFLRAEIFTLWQIVAPCRLVSVYQRFERTHCLLIQGKVRSRQTTSMSQLSTAR
jgi:hypothetical protein